MNFEEFKKEFISCLEVVDKNIQLTDDTINEFYKYMINVIEWNDKINVTAITDPKEFIVKHFVDSLTINRFVTSGGKLLDIGTGAGFPGIPLKLANEDLETVLIDSVNKKLNVIRESINDMNIEKISIIHARAEELARDDNYREQFDFVTTRAVSQLSTILEYMIPFLKVGGIAICMKGPNYQEEIDNIQNTLQLLDCKITEIENIKILDDYERNIIIVEKLKKTSEKFPRPAGKPLKEPLN